MDEAREILGQIRVVVEFLDSSLKHFSDPEEHDEHEFVTYLLQYLNDLLTDLTIPAKVSWSVRFNEGKNKLVPYHIFINGSKCRLPVPIKVAENVNAEELARVVARSIYQNREYLMTTPLSEKILEEWISEYGKARLAELSVENFHSFLLALIRQGLRINRGKEVIPAFQEKERWDFEKCLEEATSGMDITTIRVFLSGKSPRTQSTADDKSIEEMFELIQVILYYELGLLLPKVSVDTDESLKENEFRIQLNDIRFPPLSGLNPDQFLVKETSYRLSLFDIPGEVAINPENGSECILVQDRDNALEKCRDMGLMTWGSAGFIILHLTGEIRRNASIFLTAGIVEFSMNLLKEAFPALVDTAFKRFDLSLLTQILRELIDEGICIRDLRGILEGLLAVNSTTNVDLSKFVFFPNFGNLCPVTEEKTVKDLDAVEYANSVRISLKHSITKKFAMDTKTIVYFRMDPDIETKIRNIDKKRLTDEEREQLIKAIFDKIGGALNVSSTLQRPVILTMLDIRKRLRKLIEKEFPQLGVLCYQELSPNWKPQPIGQISLELRIKDRS